MPSIRQPSNHILPTGTAGAQIAPNSIPFSTKYRPSKYFLKYMTD